MSCVAHAETRARVRPASASEDFYKYLQSLVATKDEQNFTLAYLSPSRLLSHPFDGAYFAKERIVLFLLNLTYGRQI